MLQHQLHIQTINVSCLCYSVRIQEKRNHCCSPGCFKQSCFIIFIVTILCDFQSPRQSLAQLPVVRYMHAFSDKVIKNGFSFQIIQCLSCQTSCSLSFLTFKSRYIHKKNCTVRTEINIMKVIYQSLMVLLST